MKRAGRAPLLPVLFIPAFLLLAAGSLHAAEETDTTQAQVGGTIPPVSQLDIASDFIWDLSQDGAGETAFDDGYVESAADQTTLSVSSNTAWYLEVNYDGSGWSCPAGYDKPETDLLLRITNTPTGTIQNGYDSYRSPPGAASLERMLEHDSGTTANNVAIQYKVLLDWTNDIPGDYSVTLTYTLTTGTL